MKKIEENVLVKRNELEQMAFELNISIEELTNDGIYNSFRNWRDRQAVVSWHYEDVISRALDNGIIFSIEEAKDFLSSIRDVIKEMMIQDGWYTIDNCFYEMDKTVGIRKGDIVRCISEHNLFDVDVYEGNTAEIIDIQHDNVTINFIGVSYTFDLDTLTKNWMSQRKYISEYIEKETNDEKPYVLCNILCKDCEDAEELIIKIGKTNENNDDNVFYWVSNVNEFIDLLQPNNSMDFIIIDVLDVQRR